MNFIRNEEPIELENNGEEMLFIHDVHMSPVHGVNNEPETNDVSISEQGSSNQRNSIHYAGTGKGKHGLTDSESDDFEYSDGFESTDAPKEVDFGRSFGASFRAKYVNFNKGTLRSAMNRFRKRTQLKKKESEHVSDLAMFDNNN